MKRSDLSDKLIHFTKGESKEISFQNLLEILDNGVLLGSCENIKGKWDCICFTETPKGIIEKNGFGKNRYSEFGIIFNKRELFNMGARPVIYQTNKECDLLHKSIRWKNVRYDEDIGFCRKLSVS
ncbi:hypothetical protein fh0823_23510 [Francisella halioticida]|nr:hypothetical protein [Francisella halioticida]BCD92212.1 hypothetical protein fh0823_23510 [Francisella halioticida]